MELRARLVGGPMDGAAVDLEFLVDPWIPTAVLVPESQMPPTTLYPLVFTCGRHAPLLCRRGRRHVYARHHVDPTLYLYQGVK